MKKFFLSPALAACSLFSDLDQRVSLLECKMKYVRDETVYPCRNGARFPNERPVTTGYGLWASGEVIYWRAIEGGTDYVATTNLLLPNIQGDVKKVQFDWDVGYRLGLGFSPMNDNWDLFLNFTRIEPDGNAYETVSGSDSLIPILSPDFLLNGATSSTCDWDIKYSTLDFEMGRGYFVSRFLSLRPHFGLRGAWISQDISTSYLIGSREEYINSRNDFRGAGLRFGADSKWYLTENLNITFLSSFSSLFGHFKVGEVRKEHVANQINFTSDQAESISKFTLSTQAFLGLGWETFFAEDRNHISLLVGYEVNYWWRQNQLVRFVNQPATADIPVSIWGLRSSKDLSFHGLTFDAQLSF